MNTYVALFRGINVGGRNILPMRDLVRLLERMGCHEIRTYIQSGNAVFKSNRKQSRKLARDISARVREDHGFEPTVLLLEIAALQDAIDHNPFKTTDGRTLHFFFLAAPPRQPDLERLWSVKRPSEAFKLTPNVFYLYAPEGIGRSKLAAGVEQALGVAVTARNWNTVNKLLALAQEA